MDESESHELKVFVDKAIKYLVEKIMNADLKPIEVTLNSSGESN